MMGKWNVEMANNQGNITPGEFLGTRFIKESKSNTSNERSIHQETEQLKINKKKVDRWKNKPH